MKDNIINNKYSGFFLIELLIAISIFSITCLLIAQFHTNIIIQNAKIAKFTKALNIGSSILDEISILGLKENSFMIDEYNILIEPLSKSMTGVKSFQQYKINISWKTIDKASNKISLIDGYLV